MAGHRRREEAESSALEWQRRCEKEQRRREVAEERAQAQQPLTLHQYLEACHSLNVAMQVVTDCSLNTQDDFTDLTGRIFPRRIIPWDDFTATEIWDEVLAGHLFLQVTLPARNQLEYAKKWLKPISNKDAFRNSERDALGGG